MTYIGPDDTDWKCEPCHYWNSINRDRCVLCDRERTEDTSDWPDDKKLDDPRHEPYVWRK